MSTASPSRSAVGVGSKPPSRPPPPAGRRSSTDVEGNNLIMSSENRTTAVPAETIGQKSLWDDLFGSSGLTGVSSTSTTVNSGGVQLDGDHRADAWLDLGTSTFTASSTDFERRGETTSGFDDRFDAALMPQTGTNGHVISSGGDSSLEFVNEFLGNQKSDAGGNRKEKSDPTGSQWSGISFNIAATGTDVGRAPASTNFDSLFGGSAKQPETEVDSVSRSLFGNVTTNDDDGGGWPSSGGGTVPIVSGEGRARPRPRPQTQAAGNVANPFNIALQAATAAAAARVEEEDEDEEAVFTSSSTTNNPFAVQDDDTSPAGGGLDVADAAAGGFNPFATITDEETVSGGVPQGGEEGVEGVMFDPFQTIHDDDALNVPFSSEDRDTEDDVTSPSRFNPFDKEPPLSDKYSTLQPKPPPSDDVLSPKSKSEASSFEDPEPDDMEPLEPFIPHWTASGGWNLLLRQPFRKQLTQNRFWKPAFVRVARTGESDVITAVRVYSDDKSSECLHELVLQPSYSLCEMGLQQMDQYGKCHTVKIQQIVYKESVGVKSDRIAPTIGDLARVRDLKGLKDLIHKPKATMLLDHAPHATEILKFASLDYAEFKNFVYTMQDLFFYLRSSRGGKMASYTKDEITVDVQDEYCADIDRDGHITRHKARVRLFCLAFLTGAPTLEVGVNDRRRRGREVVGRRDIIPIKTEEWIRIEDWELHKSIDLEEFDRSKVLRFVPLDACRFELMRFRVRPRPNVELPLQVRVQMSVVDRHVEIRAEVTVTGYYSSSRRAAQTPCEDIQIRFPIPEPWIYLFRVERRFKYGSVHSATRKPGRIKGLERLTQLAQGILPPSLIEVSAGLAKYEHVFKAIVWRIDQLPERNEGAYKTHLLSLNVDLGPQDSIPDSLDKFVNVEYSMANSTVSRAQIRSISLAGCATEDPPDRWVRHTALYDYTVEIEFTDRVRCKPDTDVDKFDGSSPPPPTSGPRSASRTASSDEQSPGGRSPKAAGASSDASSSDEDSD